jgi:hypothetical protein
MAFFGVEPMSGFDWYWWIIGLPLSRLKGFIVDQVPFSIVESALCLGIALTLVWVTLWLPWSRLFPASADPNSAFPPVWARFYQVQKFLRKTLVIGPIGLLILGMGQGAFPLSLSPSAWRQAIGDRIGHAPLPQHKQDSLLAFHWNHLWHSSTESSYASLSDEEALVTCNRLLDSVLARLKLPPGRTVRAIKPMGTLTTAMGLIYGGPAFHDPLFGELAIVQDSEMPSSRVWRLHATCHETAHAKGFTREMDAELLTQLALTWSDDVRYQILGDLIYLSKSGKAFPYPPHIRRDILSARERRKKVESNQMRIAYFRKLAEKWGLRNSPKKYGDRDPHDQWDENHPFYAPLTEILTTQSNPIQTYAP